MTFFKSLLFLFFLGICASTNGEEFRTFIGFNGKAIEDRLISFDTEKEIVRIKMKDGRDQTVLLSLFSAKDQEFIRNGEQTDNPFDDDAIEKKPNRWLERFWSVLATCEQQGTNVMSFLNSCIVSFLHGLAPPSLLRD